MFLSSKLSSKSFDINKFIFNDNSILALIILLQANGTKLGSDKFHHYELPNFYIFTIKQCIDISKFYHENYGIVENMFHLYNNPDNSETIKHIKKHNNDIFSLDIWDFCSMFIARMEKPCGTKPQGYFYKYNVERLLQINPRLKIRGLWQPPPTPMDPRPPPPLPPPRPGTHENRDHLFAWFYIINFGEMLKLKRENAGQNAALNLANKITTDFDCDGWFGGAYGLNNPQTYPQQPQFQLNFTYERNIHEFNRFFSPTQEKSIPKHPCNNFQCYKKKRNDPIKIPNSNTNIEKFEKKKSDLDFIFLLLMPIVISLFFLADTIPEIASSITTEYFLFNLYLIIHIL